MWIIFYFLLLKTLTHTFSNKLNSINIEKILNKKAKSSSLFYYIYFFVGKEKAEQYFNKFINEDKLKSKYKGLYHSLEKLPKESIDVNISEFLGADIVKFAYLNGIKMD